MGPDDVFPDEQEGGSYEYFPDESKLVLSGSSQIEFEVTHFSADDLWLMPLGNFNGAGGVQAVYKLRKEQIH